MYNGRRLLGSRARATGAPWLACFLLLSLADLPPAMSADSAIAKYAKMRKHPFLFQPWPADVFDPKFLELVQSIKEGKSLDELLQSKLLVKQVDGVYSFPMLKHDFCDKFLAEIDSYFASGLPIRRPNSMNNYGLIVNEIGMEPSITALQQQYILPLAKLLYPKQGHAFHAHHSFMVEYKAGHDLGLDMHTDDSDVTLNVCMGREFTGAGLSFCGYVGQPDHRLFQTAYQAHTAATLTHSGERNNLIIWNHNNNYRRTEDYLNKEYHSEQAPPDLRCLSYTHDRDYEAFLDVPAGKKSETSAP